MISACDFKYLVEAETGADATEVVGEGVVVFENCFLKPLDDLFFTIGSRNTLIYTLR